MLDIKQNVKQILKFNILYGLIAQLVEQGTENPCVSGSIPLQATNTNTFKDLESC